MASQFEVHTAVDMITTAHALPLSQPSLVLAQLRLQSFGGLELVRRLKEDHATRSIPVILYADIATADERVQALNMGAADLLIKPFANAELVARLRAALKAQQAFTVLERRAHLDGLTGLANRGVFEDHLLREWDVCRRRSVPLSTVIVDLDHFKSINDTYGHATGDLVLRHAAKILALSVRSSDLVARYGGEEFVVVAPDCPQVAAVTVAKRFRTNLANQPVTTEDKTIKVTASIGISTTDWTQHSRSELVHQSDQALYQAKRAGRDAIWVYDTSLAAPAVAVASGSP
jgi:diguanylate cyclase (GGDEF)-like protein